MSATRTQLVPFHERLQQSRGYQSWVLWRRRKAMQRELRRAVLRALDSLHPLQTRPDMHRVAAMKQLANGQSFSLVVDCVPISTDTERVDVEDDDAGIFPPKELATHQYLTVEGYLVWRMPDEPIYWLYRPRDVVFMPLLEEMNRLVDAYNQRGCHAATVTLR